MTQSGHRQLLAEGFPLAGLEPATLTHVRNELLPVRIVVRCTIRRMRRTRHILSALEKRVPILCLRPRLEVVKGDVGELTAERFAIDREAEGVRIVGNIRSARRMHRGRFAAAPRQFVTFCFDYPAKAWAL
jgi:hypothetical protein